MTLFDILKDVIKEKKGDLHLDPEFDSAFNVFMLARFLSMRKDLIATAQWMNQYGCKMSKENAYRYLLANIPRSSNYFIKYIKKLKKNKEKKD